jgi:hypothetical protein
MDEETLFMIQVTLKDGSMEELDLEFEEDRNTLEEYDDGEIVEICSDLPLNGSGIDEDVDTLIEAAEKFFDIWSTEEQGAFLLLMEDKTPIEYALDTIRDRDYSYYPDDPLEDLGLEILETEQYEVFKLMQELNLLCYFDFEDFAEDALTDYSYLPGYGSYMFF